MKDGNQMLFYSDDKVDSSFCEHFWLRKKKKTKKKNTVILVSWLKSMFRRQGFKSMNYKYGMLQA